MQGTGGGPAVAINISDLEQKLLAILTPKAAGMPNIPEGELITKTNLNSMVYVQFFYFINLHYSLVFTVIFIIHR